MSSPLSGSQFASTQLMTGFVVGLVFVGVVAVCYQFSWGVYDTKYNFMGRSPAERREAFKTEAAFYYNFFEDVVEQKSFQDGLKLLAAHPSVEAPKTIDTIMRFNIHPEITIGWLYRQLFRDNQVLALGFVDSVVFYTRSAMFLFGLDKGWLFLAATLGGGGDFAAACSGLVTVLSGFANVNYYSRIWNHPPLRENFGMPFVALQYVGLFLAMPVHSNGARGSRGAMLRGLGLLLWFVGIVALLLCWQLGLFILFGQVTSLIIVCGIYKHNAIVRLQATRLLETTLAALLVTLYFQHGNPLTLHSLTFSFVAAAVAAISGAAKYWPGWSKIVTPKMHPIAEALVLCVASAAGMIVLKKILQVVFGGGDEGDHIFAVLMTKLGYDEYENLDTVLYNTMSVFNTNWSMLGYLQESYLIQLVLVSILFLAIRAVDEMLQSRRTAAGATTEAGEAQVDAPSALSSKNKAKRFKIPKKKKAAAGGSTDTAQSDEAETKKDATSSTSFSAAAASSSVQLETTVAPWLVVTGTTVMWTFITCIMFRFVAVAMPHWQLLASLAFSHILHGQVFQSVKRLFGKAQKTSASGSVFGIPAHFAKLGHLVLVISAVYSFGYTSYDLYHSRVGPVADGQLQAQQDLLAAMSWIETATPKNSIFSSRMYSAPHIRLIGKRRTTIHPQWEDADIRRRGRVVYPMYSRYSVPVVWGLLHSIEEEAGAPTGNNRPDHYILLSRRYCKTGTAVGEGLFVDQVTRALKRPEPPQKKAFCEAVLGAEGTPYFELVFNANDVFIMRVNPVDPVEHPDKAFKTVNLQAALLTRSKALNEKSNRDETQAAISSLCSYAEYMVETKTGKPADSMTLLEEAMRLSVAKGSSNDLLPAYKSCFCLYASQLQRKEGGSSSEMLRYYQLSTVAQISGFSSAYDRRDCLNDVALTMDEELKSPLKAIPFYELGKSLTAGGTAAFLGNFGYAMYLHGNVAFAEQLFRESLQRNPRNAHNLCGAAIVFWERGRREPSEKNRVWPSARAVMAKAHSIDSSNQCVGSYYETIMKQTQGY